MHNLKRIGTIYNKNSHVQCKNKYVWWITCMFYENQNVYLKTSMFTEKQVCSNTNSTLILDMYYLHIKNSHVQCKKQVCSLKNEHVHNKQVCSNHPWTDQLITRSNNHICTPSKELIVTPKKIVKIKPKIT